MNYKHTCNCCGSTVTAYVHRLNKGMIDAMWKLYMANKTKDYVKLSDLKLTTNQYNNFQKLRYFGLVIRKTEGYSVTGKGKTFLVGMTRIPNRVATMGNMVLPYNHEAWETDSKLYEYKYVYDYNIDFSYKIEYEAIQENFRQKELF